MARQSITPNGRTITGFYTANPAEQAHWHLSAVVANPGSALVCCGRLAYLVPGGRLCPGHLGHAIRGLLYQRLRRC